MKFLWTFIAISITPCLFWIGGYNFPIERNMTNAYLIGVSLEFGLGAWFAPWWNKE